MEIQSHSFDDKAPTPNIKKTIALMAIESPSARSPLNSKEMQLLGAVD
jgi:hypothetical protein